MLTFDNDYNILVFSDKKKSQKKSFLRKHWKKLALGAAGALAIGGGILAYKNKDKLKSMFTKNTPSIPESSNSGNTSSSSSSSYTSSSQETQKPPRNEPKPTPWGKGYRYYNKDGSEITPENATESQRRMIETHQANAAPVTRENQEKFEEIQRKLGIN